jgi:CBS domain containing-hemolysin-like protein
MIALELVAVALLLILNAFFVAAEYALVRSRRARLEQAAAQGRRGAQLALSQIDDLNDYISVVQVGVTMASIGIGAIGEPAMSDLLHPLFGGWLNHALATVFSIAIAYLLISGLQVVLSELVPKLVAIRYAEPVAMRGARLLLLFRYVFLPFSSVLTSIANWILRRFGIDPDRLIEEGGSPEELRLLIQQSVTGGKLDPGEAGMLTGVFHLHEQQARQVMTPAPAVITVDVSEDAETALRRCVSSGHTRLVVTEDDNQDRVKGLVHANALGQLLLTEGPQASIEGVVREAPIVPETKPLDDLLADLQRQRSSLAVVIDEYGRTAGIVTVEDIIEEVVGEIDDETDPQGGAVRRLANGDWFVRGHVAITDLQDYGLELPVDSDAYNSVGGFVFGELGRLPKRGDVVSHDGYSIRVESVRENRIEAVRIRDRRVGAEREPQR